MALGEPWIGFGAAGISELGCHGTHAQGSKVHTKILILAFRMPKDMSRSLACSWKLAPSWTLGWSRLRCPRLVSNYSARVQGFVAFCASVSTKLHSMALGRGCIRFQMFRALSWMFFATWFQLAALNRADDINPALPKVRNIP